MQTTQNMYISSIEHTFELNLTKSLNLRCIDHCAAASETSMLYTCVINVNIFMKLIYNIIDVENKNICVVYVHTAYCFFLFVCVLLQNPTTCASKTSANLEEAGGEEGEIIDTCTCLAPSVALPHLLIMQEHAGVMTYASPSLLCCEWSFLFQMSLEFSSKIFHNAYLPSSMHCLTYMFTCTFLVLTTEQSC